MAVGGETERQNQQRQRRNGETEPVASEEKRRDESVAGAAPVGGRIRGGGLGRRQRESNLWQGLGAAALGGRFRGGGAAKQHGGGGLYPGEPTAPMAAGGRRRSRGA